MWETNATIEDRDLIDDGLVIAYHDESIELSIKPETFSEDNEQYEEAGVSFLIEFEDDGGDPTVNDNMVDDNVVELTFVNHRDVSDVGSSTKPLGPLSPVDVGALGNRRLLLGYYVTSLVSEDRMPEATSFYYNFYLGLGSARS